MIPVLDLTRQYQEIAPEIERAVLGVFKSGTFINGPNVAALEEAIARYVGCRHAIGVNSGTDALHLALRALGVGPGDEVITTPFSFIATSEAISMVGARAIFADIDAQTLNIDPAAVAAAVTPRTRAVIPVHLYGRPAPMAELLDVARRHCLAVVEDCAQSIGASIEGKRTGSFGHAGAFSFFPSKNLGAYGDGGAIVTNDADLARRMRRLRAHGADVKYYHEEQGVNSRLDELQAAILRVKLPHLDRWIELRQTIAAWYTVALGRMPAVAVPAVPSTLRHVYHQYTIRVAERNRIQKVLHEYGISTMIYYPVPLHLQPVAAPLGLCEGAFPNAERAAREVLSLPIYPELRDVEVDAVVRALEHAVPGSVPCAS